VGSASDQKRTGRGLIALRKRYILRAENLASSDVDFRSDINQSRQSWNSSYPDYKIIPSAPNDLGYVPESLERAQNRVLEALAVTYSRPPATSGRETDAQRNDRSAALLSVIDTFRIQEEWNQAIIDRIRRWFPADDFPNPYPAVKTMRRTWAGLLGAILDGREPPMTYYPNKDTVQLYKDYGFNDDPNPLMHHPASRFIALALQSHLELVADAAMWIPEFKLVPLDLSTYNGNQSQPIDSTADLYWYLPLYNGITATDIKNSAHEIAEFANGAYAKRAADSRIVDLHLSGLSHAEIERKTGIPEQTVRDTLKKLGH
jgi:hypothetical protein